MVVGMRVSSRIVDSYISLLRSQFMGVLWLSLRLVENHTHSCVCNYER